MLTGLHLVSIDKKTNRVLERPQSGDLPVPQSLTERCGYRPDRSSSGSAWPDKRISTVGTQNLRLGRDRLAAYHIVYV